MSFTWMGQFHTAIYILIYIYQIQGNLAVFSKTWMFINIK